MKKLSICLAALAALALPATASAASQFFGGNIENGGKIGIDVTTQGGQAFQIDALRYKKFPANCTVIGPAIADASWFFSNVLVVENKFSFNGDAPNGDHLEFKGTFKRQDKKIEGKVKFGPVDGGSGIGTCTSARRDYTAKRGDPGPHPQPKAKIHRAFRVR